MWHIQMSCLVWTTIQIPEGIQFTILYDTEKQMEGTSFFFFAYEMTTKIVAGLTFIFFVG